MAWTAPMTFTANAVLSAAQLNTHLRDNLNETAVAKATGSGTFFVGTGPNQLAERTPSTDRDNQEGTTTSSSFTDLDDVDVGPEVTLTTGTKALVLWSCELWNDSDTTSNWATVEVSGDSNISPNANVALEHEGTYHAQFSTFNVFDELSAGTNIFTMKYRCSSGTMHVSDRAIAVVPF